MESKGMEVLDKFSDAVRVLLVDDDKICHLELARMLRLSGYEVTERKGAKGALDWLRKDTSRFDIIITERNLPDVELLRKVVREMDLLVIAMPCEGGVEAMPNSIIHGASKPNLMNFLLTLGQYVQQPTNDVSKAKKGRFSWTPNLHKIFTDCVEELKKKAIKPTPKKIAELMEAKGVKGLTIGIVKSHHQKWQGKLKKEASQLDMQGHNDKDGPSSVHVLESMNSATQLKRAPTAMNISSQHHRGAPQIMTQPSSSRQICNDLPGGQAFDASSSINASANLFANNPQNQDLDETMLDSFDDTDLYLDLSNFDEHEDGPSSVHALKSLDSATQLPQVPAAMNISSQHHIGASQIMTQPSSSRQICNDLPRSQAFDDGTSINASTYLRANNPQNQDLDEIMLPPFGGLDAYCNSYNKDTIPDIDLWEFDN